MKMKWSINTSAFNNMSVNVLLWVLVGMSSLVLVSIAAFSFYSVYKQGTHVVDAVDISEANIREVALSQKAATNFRKQVQEWQNILMRGDDQEDFKRYVDLFEKQEVEVQGNLMDLRVILSQSDQEIVTLLDTALRKHADQGAKYREALESYDMENPKESGIMVDSMVLGVDVATLDHFDKLTESIEKQMVSDLEKDRQLATSDLKRSSIIFTVMTVFALAITFLLATPIRKGVNQAVQRINALRDEAEKQNKRNQDAILRLLDEVANLADGDLTNKPVVTEEITGAIADSLGYAIDTLRNLVGAINTTAVQVAAEAFSTQEKALQLTAASDQQAQEINIAGMAVTEMTHSIEQVSKNAVESSAVAQKSVEIAKKGAQTVQGTIQGMEAIREQIQETSKRIKRLGESSHEIGEIVALINDIADQTSVLALNASIQAAMAGEAGRGFSVVADEVQRLSERVGNSTKQIENLVKAIQTDTNEAAISMEKSSSGAVSGARLAQDAGKALAEIETVSVNLNKLIEGISSSARQQSTTAGDVSNRMKLIQDITTQTSEGTRQAAVSIGQLTGMAGELRKSVAGFKLPG